MALEQQIKDIWPAALGKARFSHAEETESIPFTILHLINSKKIHKDGGWKNTFVADCFSRTIDIDAVRTAIESISIQDAAIVINNMETDYDPDRKCHITAVEFQITSNN